MVDWQLKTPVCLIIFKRPDTTERVFEAIRQVKPPKLLVIADGPRQDRPGEVEKCAATRKIIDGVDWDCEVLKNYSDVNLGLKQRVASGLDWVFETVEEAIVLEDDCLPHPTFFRFSEELLDSYRYDERVMVIAGTNFLFGWKRTPYSYYFSRYIDCWGWATWRRAWQHFDYEMKQWPEIRDNHWLADILQDTRAAEQWTRTFQATYDGQINSWAFRWKLACWIQNGLTILPQVNLVSNIGFNAESTNTADSESILSNTPVEAIAFPLKHPNFVIRDAQADDFTQKVVFGSEPLELRKKMANLWLNITTEELESTYQQNTIIKIIKIGFRAAPLTEAEKIFVKELIAYMSRVVDEPKAIQYLLAAMLYTYPHKLPVQYDLSRIPQWLLNDYLKFTFEPPRLFQEIGEVDSYYEYLLRWVNTLHASIFAYPTSQVWQEVAFSFTQKANFRPLYLTTADIKNLYIKRAEILEFTLKAQGYQLDYEFPERLPERNKIRLGILANNFGFHPETLTSLPIYKCLNRDLFEIVLYPLYASGDRLERYCSGHADIGVKLPEDLESQVNKIRTDDLDILYIASNITAEANMMTLLALHRVARVQVVGMNSPVTTGLRYVDYYIAGKLTEPDNEAQKHYTETLITVDGSGLCLDFGSEEQGVPTIKISRESLGIPQNAVVYASGANFDDITPEVEESWAKVMESVPNSQLMLYTLNPTGSSSYLASALKQRLGATWARHGLNENRLIFVFTVQNRADVKEVLKLGDIYLDAYPCSNIASLVEPLQVGLPTVVMEGNFSRSLLGSSLLREVQVPDLIASGEEAYIQLAASLGTNSGLRQLLSDLIKQKLSDNPRFLDSRSYSAQMEAIFQQLFQKQQEVALKANLRLGEINSIAFPDWSQSEEIILPDIASAIRTIVTHPEKGRMTLLIDTTNISDEDADTAISSVVMNLMMEEDLDVSDGPEICLIGQMSARQWQALLPRLHARIVLENENKQAIATAGAEKIPTHTLDNLI